MGNEKLLDFRTIGREVLSKYFNQKADAFVAEQVIQYVTTHNSSSSAEELASSIADFIKAREITWGIVMNREYFAQEVLRARMPSTLQQAVDAVHLRHLSGGKY